MLRSYRKDRVQLWINYSKIIRTGKKAIYSTTRKIKIITRFFLTDAESDKNSKTQTKWTSKTNEKGLLK